MLLHSDSTNLWHRQTEASRMDCDLWQRAALVALELNCNGKTPSTFRSPSTGMISCRLRPRLHEVSHGHGRQPVPTTPSDIVEGLLA